MSKGRKVWGEGFVLGLLVGIAALACLTAGPATRAAAPASAGSPLVRLTRRSARDIEAARYLSDLPAPSSAIH